MLNLGLDIQTLILYHSKVFNKCIVFYEYGFKSCSVFFCFVCFFNEKKKTCKTNPLSYDFLTLSKTLTLPQ